MCRFFSYKKTLNAEVFKLISIETVKPTIPFHGIFLWGHFWLGYTEAHFA